LDSLALIFGRDQLVRTLTEHDFYGSNPNASDRIRLFATITGFSSKATSAHSQFVRQDSEDIFAEYKEVL
jgi:putative ATP-dependent endonuclease of OLD family